MNSRLFDCAQQYLLMLVVFLLSFTQVMAQNGVGCQVPGVDLVFSDSFEENLFCPEPCFVNAQIQAVRDSGDGLVSLPVEHAYVSYIRPTVGGDPTGFYLQGRNNTGPAIYVNIDPSGLAPPLEVGDVISLRVTEVGSLGGVRNVVSLSDLVVEAKGQPLNGLVQEVSLNTDLVSNIDGYESELLSLNGSISSEFTTAGTGFESAILSTQVVIDNPNLRLRLPADLRNQLSLTQGCMIKLCGTPMWRFFNTAQPSAWIQNDIDVIACPAPKVVLATATGANSVQITFDRQIDPSSLSGDGSQFTFDNGLIATSALATGNLVQVSTGTQLGGQLYQVSVAGSLTDTLGKGVDASANSTEFSGFQQPAVLQVNEINANIANGCDLVELRVISSGSMGGIYLKERIDTVLSFTDFFVNTGDFIVVHFDSGDANCNGTGSSDESSSIDSQPNAQHPQNYDYAYDWYTNDTGITSTDNVLTVYYSHGLIMDSVLASDDVTGSAAAASETQAAEVASAGHWQMVEGGVPEGGFVDDNFNLHAAQDLNATGVTAESGESIQRNDNIDNNDKSDWTMGPQSWGQLNSGQSN